MPQPAHRLSKSRFTAGVQCHRLLWWKVHERDAEELQPGKVLQDLFDQGRQVGLRAQDLFPGGTLVDRDFRDYKGKMEDTTAALAAGAPAIFEASFEAHNTFVAVDVLEQAGAGFNLIEVKSSSRQKEEHIPDSAVQRYVLEQNGLSINRVEILHLNKEHRFPGINDLFGRTDVTTPVDEYVSRVPGEIDRQLDTLRGDLPDIPIGLHCFEPRECPFMKRCWPQDRKHIKKFQGVGPKTAATYLQTGVHWISDLPPTKKLNWNQKRQLRAMEEDRIIVEPTLVEALAPFDCRLGYLDFETIMRAIPVWPGLAPWGQAAAQFSYHEDRPGGSSFHADFLAEGPRDARPFLAERMVEVTKNSERVVMYTSFEKTRIRSLQKSVPDLAGQLKELEEKLIDLHPIIKNNVYHPAFEGSFSLKYILNPLVPELTYDDLIIVDGMVASVEIARLLFVSGKIPPDQIDKTRKDLLDYCERDTWAMVQLLARLRELAASV